MANRGQHRLCYTNGIMQLAKDLTLLAIACISTVWAAWTTVSDLFHGRILGGFIAFLATLMLLYLVACILDGSIHGE